MKAQRLRLRYRVTSSAGSLSNRDLVAAWEAAIRDAGFSLAYSEGKRPSPQVSLAAPLPLGITSDFELADIYLAQPADPLNFIRTVGAHLPAGIDPVSVAELGVDAPSLQSQLRRAEYEVTLPAAKSEAILRQRVNEVLAATTLPSEYVRTNKVKAYDLRPLVLSIDISKRGESTVIRMRLRAEQENTARSDQVLLALGIEGEAQIHRTRLELDDVSAILQAYRRAGEPSGADLQMILYLVRHGETDHNRNSLALGHADVPLNDRGLSQVSRLGAALAGEPISAIYSSPLGRARQTANALASHRGVKVQVRPGLIEMDIGEADGLTFPEVRERFPGLLETWVTDDGPKHPMPGGERLVDVQKRAWDCVQSLATLHPNDTICAVTHNFVILSILTTALGMDLAGFRRLRHGVAAVSVLEVGPSRVRIKRLNDTCHLEH